MGQAARIRGVDGHRQRRLTSPAAARGGAGAGQRWCVGRNRIVGGRGRDQVFPPLGFDRRAEAGRSLKTRFVTQNATWNYVALFSTGSATRDRKSTRLNSSHRCISYAVFCLKKKKK